MQFSARPLADGIVMSYFLTSEAGRLTEDGSCEITLRGTDIIFSASGKNRPKNEDVLYRLMLHELRDGQLKEGCALAWPAALLYPPSAGVARLVAKMDAACLVDKKGQYRRF